MSIQSFLVDIEEDDLKIMPSFQPDDWPDISSAYQYYFKSWFCKPMKFIVDHQIIGIGNIIFFQHSAWLSQIIISEEFRNRGWGKVITKNLIELCSGYRSISLLATDLGYPVYASLGFETQGVYHFYRGKALNENDIANNIEEYRVLDHCDILALDKQLSGETRARLLQEHVSRAKVIYDGDHLLAYYLPSLGDGLIVSKTPDAGLQLLRYHLRANGKICIPIENKIASDFLSGLGFTQYRKAHRMVIGEPIKYNPEWIYSRIGGNLG